MLFWHELGFKIEKRITSNYSPTSNERIDVSQQIINSKHKQINADPEQVRHTEKEVLSVDVIIVVLCLGIALSREIRAWYKVLTRKKK